VSSLSVSSSSQLKPPLPHMMAQVAIKRSIAICGGSLSRPWHVDDVSIIDGTEFVELSFADKGFLAFVFGKDTKGHRNSSYLQQLKDIRTDATIKATKARPEVSDLFDDAPDIKVREKKRLRAEVKAADDRGELPKFLVVEAPGVANDAGVVMSIAFKVIPSLHRWSNLKVEATPATLAFIRDAVLKSQTAVDDARVMRAIDGAPVKGVYWRSARNCFMATDTNGVTKQFRPEGDDEQSVATALSQAAAWAASDCDVR